MPQPIPPLLLDFIVGGEPRVPEADAAVPLTFCLVVAHYEGRYLFLYHAERQQWETPGGGIEPGETPEDCARRELREETGQVAVRLDYKGLFKIRLPDDHLEYGALYATELDEIHPFEVNAEGEEIAFWEYNAESAARITELSLKLMAHCGIDG